MTGFPDSAPNVICRLPGHGPERCYAAKRHQRETRQFDNNCPRALYPAVCLGKRGTVKQDRVNYFCGLRKSRIQQETGIGKIGRQRGLDGHIIAHGYHSLSWFLFLKIRTRRARFDFGMLHVNAPRSPTLV